jgi:hypothetical protein
MRHSPGTMKPHLCLFLVCAGMLAAQDQPKDPFIKDKKPEAKPVIAENAPKNIQCLVETFTLTQTDYAALLDAPEGREKLYSHTLAAVQAGTAKMDGCHLITGRNNTRSTLESTDELIYPTSWTHADRKGFQYPTAFEMRQLGDHFEFEPTLDEENGTLNLSHQFSRDRLLGIHLAKADTTLAGVPVVDVFSKMGVSNIRMIPNCPTLISTLNEAQTRDVTLVFATLRVIHLAVPKVPAPKGAGNLMLTARVISLDRTKGWDLLKKHEMEGGACLAALKPLLAAKDATLEHIATVMVESGVRSVHESGLQYLYGTEFSVPTEGVAAQPSNDPQKPGIPAQPAELAGTTAFQSRSLGFRLEVEPVRSEDGAFADVTLAPEDVRMTGNLKDKNWSEHYPEVPLYSCQKITTGYVQVIGSTTLIGTMNPPGDTGANEHKDEGRMWLLFMDVNQE